MIKNNTNKKFISTLGNIMNIFFLNKSLPIKNFLSNLPESLKKIFIELDELHEIELYERLFTIRQAEKLIQKASQEETKFIFSIKKKLIIIKNKTIINFNKRILNIFFKISIPGKRS